MKRVIYTTGKVCKRGVHLTARLFFPWILHYMTDRYKDRHHHLVVDTVFSAILITLVLFNAGLGYYFYLARTPADVSLEISVPEYVISGHGFDMAVAYENPNKRVKDAEIIVDYPEGFAYESSSVAPAEGSDNVFQLGDLSPGDGGTIEISGLYYGDVGARDHVAASVSYDFFRESSKDAFQENFLVRGSTLETQVDLPDKILDDEDFEIIVKYKNSSPLAQDDVRLDLDLPAGLTAEGDEIGLGRLEPWQEGEVRVPAHFENVSGEASSIVRVGSSLGAGEATWAQTTLEREIKVLTPRLEVSSAVNGSGGAVANFEDGLTFSATVSNIGDAPLNNVVVTGNLDNAPGAYDYFSVPGGSVSGDVVTWVLPRLEPGQSATVYANARVGSAVNVQNFSMGFSASATADIDDLGVNTYAPASSSSRVSFNSRLTFIAEAQYYGPEHRQLGYGPYPLEAGRVTALRVFWKVQDFTNDLDNLTAQTTLPSQVEWTGRFAVSDGTAMAYDPASRTVTWHVHRLDAFTHPQGANFEVAVSPNWQQVGRRINVTNDAKLTARDSFTGAVLTRYAGAVRTKDPIE